ncbi:hypothetical protein EDD75_0335 [Thermodesulfitimonas autotrophica]|uniref:Uncharacterized protein n=1 Tax=Thermodesulfitimonas autotrophica TaxID=1894989 RepID=A0A3N5AWX4_9THEO|nr:hypothetical protein [Thermodesulfitimonas autotrophica]RPF49519.1 hypothetical protein EDD75_0335 [Thermodesulfitimonas autotrophica]
MPRLEERDLFAVLEEWGYEVCPFDPSALSPEELAEITSLQEAIRELMEESFEPEDSDPGGDGPCGPPSP